MNNNPPLDTSATLGAAWLLTETEAAKRLNISPRTLFSMRRAGKVPFVRLGTNLIRYSPDELVKWIANNQTLGASDDGQSE